MIHSQSTQWIVPRKFVPPSCGQVIECKGINYFIGKKIDRGAFGGVFDCRDEWGNELVAKVLLPQDQPYEYEYEAMRRNWLREFQNLQQLRHPQVTFIHQAFEYQDTFYLIIEKCELTLENLVVDISTDSEFWLPYISRDILNGLHYIHDHGYVHNDLHAGNVFMSLQRSPMSPDQDPIWRFKIGDLGISRLEKDISPDTTLLKRMSPPEALDSRFGFRGKHVDIYHVGLLLLSLLLNQPLNFTQDEIIAGHPRKCAEGLRSRSRYASAIARALRRHVSARTPSAIDMWREISEASKNA